MSNPAAPTPLTAPKLTEQNLKQYALIVASFRTNIEYVPKSRSEADATDAAVKNLFGNTVTLNHLTAVREEMLSQLLNKYTTLDALKFGLTGKITPKHVLNTIYTQEVFDNLLQQQTQAKEHLAKLAADDAAIAAPAPAAPAGAPEAAQTPIEACRAAYSTAHSTYENPTPDEATNPGKRINQIEALIRAHEALVAAGENPPAENPTLEQLQAAKEALNPAKIGEKLDLAHTNAMADFDSSQETLAALEQRRNTLNAILTQANSTDFALQHANIISSLQLLNEAIKTRQEELAPLQEAYTAAYSVWQSAAASNNEQQQAAVATLLNAQAALLDKREMLPAGHPTVDNLKVAQKKLKEEALLAEQQKKEQEEAAKEHVVKMWANYNRAHSNLETLPPTSTPTERSDAIKRLIAAHAGLTSIGATVPHQHKSLQDLEDLLNQPMDQAAVKAAEAAAKEVAEKEALLQAAAEAAAVAEAALRKEAQLNAATVIITSEVSPAAVTKPAAVTEPAAAKPSTTAIITADMNAETAQAQINQIAALSAGTEATTVPLSEKYKGLPVERLVSAYTIPANKPDQHAIIKELYDRYTAEQFISDPVKKATAIVKLLAPVVGTELGKAVHKSKTFDKRHQEWQADLTKLLQEQEAARQQEVRKAEEARKAKKARHKAEAPILTEEAASRLEGIGTADRTADRKDKGDEKHSLPRTSPAKPQSKNSALPVIGAGVIGAAVMYFWGQSLLTTAAYYTNVSFFATLAAYSATTLAIGGLVVAAVLCALAMRVFSSKGTTSKTAYAATIDSSKLQAEMESPRRLSFGHTATAGNQAVSNAVEPDLQKAAKQAFKG